jgi:hypothetical protein
MNSAFLKPRLIYKVLTYITQAREKILKDLVAYGDDPVRAKRRLRLLIQLADYEHQLLIKIKDFTTEDPEDYGDQTLNLLLSEIDLITDISS